jgi:pimeloyl-ACP methyl ester carboxylesterase
VLVHGLGVSARYFLPLMERLAGDAEVHAPELPGCGRSSRPARVLSVPEQAQVVSDWLDAVALPAVDVVANSLGCQIALELAAARPERVRTLVLVGPTTDAAARSFPRQLARLLADTLREPLPLSWIVASDYLRAGPMRVARTASAMIAHPAVDVARRVAAPTLVVRGGRDPIAPRRWTQELAAALRHGRTAEVTGAAHAAHYSHPDETARLVLAFRRTA